MTAMDGATADLVLIARRVLTLADADVARVVAIKDGSILAVGPHELLDSVVGPATEVLDVGDRVVMPGFVDVHAHGEVAARTLATTVDCRAPTCRSVADVLQKLHESLDQAEQGWLVAQGNLFFDQKLVDGRLPTRAELDAVSREIAIAVRAGGHVTVLNTRALGLAGITSGYEAPEHSITGKPIVEREPGSDEPTGVVKEMDNTLPFPAMDEGALRTALASGFRTLFTRYGVTSIGEISETLTGIRCMDELQATHELAARVFVYLWTPGTVSLAEACRWPEQLTLRSPESLLRIQGVKMFADGGYSAASAAVKRDYVSQPGWRGAIALSEAQVAEALTRTKEAELQLAIHANGDRAQEEVCAAIERAGGAPEGALRTRIEHAGNFAPDLATTTAAWRRAGIVPVPQPVFIYTFGDYFPTYLGDYGTTGRFRFRTLLDDGWRLSGSSDVWVGSEELATNPFFSIWCCVKRETFSGQVIAPEERLSVAEALRMHTLDAAAVLGQEHAIGSLEAGKAADCLVLDRDPLTCADDDLLDVSVDAVLLGGRLAYERDGAPPVGGAPTSQPR
jgi:predicted amidohydrolase YtcJ